MRKLGMLRLLVCFLLLCCLFGGCAVEQEDELPPEPTAAISSGVQPTTEPEEAGEPSLSTAAQALPQFQLPESGTAAEIIIEDYGSIFVRFFPEQAPLAVENFLTLAREGYYDGLTFYRVVADFMIQSGDPTETGTGGESSYGAPFADELSEELHPYRGALCMANTGEAHTNGSQFFVVQTTGAFLSELEELLDYQSVTVFDYFKANYETVLTQADWAQYLLYGGAPWLSGRHTVFGQVYDGFSVLDAVAAAETDLQYHPQQAIKIQTVRLFDYPDT